LNADRGHWRGREAKYCFENNIQFYLLYKEGRGNFRANEAKRQKRLLIEKSRPRLPSEERRRIWFIAITKKKKREKEITSTLLMR